MEEVLYVEYLCARSRNSMNGLVGSGLGSICACVSIFGHVDR